MRRLAPLFLILAACDRGPELPTAEQNRDLDDAAARLDDAGNGLADIDDSELESGNRSQP